MADGPNTGPGLAGNGFLWLLMMATGTLFLTHALPLQGSRPTDTSPQIHDDRGPQNVEARLWQDPFTAISKLRSASEKPAPARIEDLLPAGGAPLVIAITVPGSPYAEDAESRRRYRYAVLAGLNVQRYVPVDGEHIGYLAPPRLPEAPPLPKVIPFEWFEPADDTAAERPKVLVLWLDENALTMAAAPEAQARPLAGLSRLARALEDGAWDRRETVEHQAALTVAAAIAGSARPPLAIKIIGPSSSGMLRSMAFELRGPSRRACRTAGQDTAPASLPFEFFDFGATVQDATLRKILCSDAPADEHAETLFRARGLRFHRLIAPDDVLARALADELERRQLRPGDQVAIVSEWDTSYGQTLLRTMKQAFADDRRIIEFSYLRGLDGQMPDADTGSGGKSADTSRRDGDDDKSKSDATSRDTAKQLERPDGQGQFDYLRRLAEQIKRRDDELARAGTGRIAAIGVLGTDPYDKLLVLQALRPVLPEATFFTTDLDARFMSPGERRTTRNLIIASGFGLDLRPAVQRHIPPFRDTYQTAAFLATQLAVHGGGADCADCAPAGRVANWLRSPRIFEIGRSGAFAFPVPAAATADIAGKDDDGAAPCRTDGLRCAEVQPASDPLVPSLPVGGARYATMLLAGLLLAAIVLAGKAVIAGLPQPTARSSAPLRSPAWRWLVIAIASVLLGAALCASWDSLAPFLTGGSGGEPMLLTEGISIWPTILLRAASFLIGLALILLSFRRLENSIDSIARELRLDELRDRIRDEGRGGLAETLRDIFSPRLLPPAVGDAERDIAAFWRIYVRRGRIGARTCRIVLCIAIIFLLWFVLSAIFGQPNLPARGNTVRAVYMVVTMLDVIATWFLIFLVADATLFACLFVRALRHAPSVWPEQSRSAFAALLGLEGPPIDEWLDTRFVAMRTRCIIGLIYFPFLLVALLILSRSVAFDSFAANPTLLITQGVSLVLLAGCVIWLRVEAEEARRTAHANLGEALIAARCGMAAVDDDAPGGAGRDDAAEARRAARAQWPDRIEEMITQVDALQAGAFMPISHQPMVRALLLPLGTYGGTALLDYLSLAGL